jgi:hypothetical protein
MYFAVNIGSFIDSKYSSDQNIYSLIFSALGIVLILFLISNQSKRLK